MVSAVLRGFASQFFSRLWVKLGLWLRRGYLFLDSLPLCENLPNLCDERIGLFGVWIEPELSQELFEPCRRIGQWIGHSCHRKRRELFPANKPRQMSSKFPPLRNRLGPLRPMEQTVGIAMLVDRSSVLISFAVIQIDGLKTNRTKECPFPAHEAHP